MSHAPDAELLARTAAGDRGAFAALYDRHAARVFGLLLKLLRNRSDAEDVLQEAFLQAWHRAAGFDPARSCPEAWVLMLARSRAIDRLRKRGAAATGDLPEPAAAADPSADLQRQEEAGEVRTALARLPGDQREPIRLAFFHGLTHAQIARLLRVPLGTIKTRIRIGMHRLRGQVSAPTGVSR